jgi:hypothetical protein
LDHSNQRESWKKLCFYTTCTSGKELF